MGCCICLLWRIDAAAQRVKSGSSSLYSTAGIIVVPIAAQSSSKHTIWIHGQQAKPSHQLNNPRTHKDGADAPETTSQGTVEAPYPNQTLRFAYSCFAVTAWVVPALCPSLVFRTLRSLGL